MHNVVPPQIARTASFTDKSTSSPPLINNNKNKSIFPISTNTVHSTYSYILYSHITLSLTLLHPAAPIQDYVPTPFPHPHPDPNSQESQFIIALDPLPAPNTLLPILIPIPIPIPHHQVR